METHGSSLLKLEIRPQHLVAAVYDELPFPTIGPVQEVALDVGVVATQVPLELRGLVFQGYHGHQLLFEQRWPADVIRARVGEEDLRIEPGMGLGLRSLQFFLHAYRQLTHMQITAVARKMEAAEEEGESVQGMVQVAVHYFDQKTDIHFPLAGTWWAIQAGDWSDLHKTEVVSQPFAYDFVKLGPDNQIYRGDGRALSDHYSWDQPVYAAAGGKVAYICYDMPDMAPGAVPDQLILRGDWRRALGNAVVIAHGNDEFSFYGHLQQASVQVAVGETVRRGTLIGRVGNSGNSPGPHLHFHLMNGPNAFIDQGLPVKFSHFWAAGQWYEQPITVPTRMILTGPERAP